MLLAQTTLSAQKLLESGKELGWAVLNEQESEGVKGGGYGAHSGKYLPVFLPMDPGEPWFS